MSLQLSTFDFPERFEVRRRLGGGAMGDVYLARDRERQGDVALKTLRSPTPGSLARFKREFRALAGVVHPNLVTLHELFAGGDLWFFTMEVIDGVDLRAYVGGDLDRLREAIAQLARGICALHDSGCLHLDIKPSNVLVTAEPRVVLLDFGVIAEIGRPPRSGLAGARVAGTPDYMAPEQARGEPAPASDWYAVGVILYELIAGVRPFKGSSRAVMFDKTRYDAQPLAAMCPGAPADLAKLCDALLDRDPTRRPGAAEILARLDAAPVPPARRRDDALIGREGALERLERSLDRALEGRGCQVHVVGESGMGKSALVAAFTRRAAAERDAVVLAGRCYPQESVPYKAVDSLLDDLARFLADLPRHEADALLPRDVLLLAKVFPVLEGVEAVAGARRRRGPEPEPRELRRRAFAALREMVGRIAETRPLILFIDDLQWGDVDSAPIIEALTRPPDAPAALLILAYRSEHADSPLLKTLLRRRARLGPSVDLAELEVRPLAGSDATSLARRLLAGAGRDDLPQLIASESGGAPFFIHELAMAARDGVAAVSLERVVASRLGELDEAERRVIELIALAAKPIAEPELAAAGSLTATELSPALGRLRAARFVRVDDAGSLECYHDRIREAVAAGLDGEQRRAHHLRLAAALAGAPSPDLEALMVHSEAAGDRAAAATYAREAAAQAERALAFERAAELWSAALGLGPEGEDTRELRARLGTALENAGRGAEAAEAFLEAAREAPAVERLELERRAASAYLRSGRLESGMRTLEKVLETIDAPMPPSPRRALASLLYNRLRLRARGLDFRRVAADDIEPFELARLDALWTSATDLGMVDTLRASHFAARQLRVALELGEPTRVARALTAEAMFLAARGDREATEEVLARAGALAEDIDDPELLAWLTAARGMLDYQHGAFRDSLARSEACLRHLRDECAGVLWETGGVEVQALWSLFYLGELRELSARVDALVEIARVRGNRFDETHLCTGLPALAWLAVDRPEPGRRELATAMSRWSSRGFHLQHYYELLAACSFDLYEGRIEEAWGRLEKGWPALRRSRLMFIPSLAIEAHHLRGRVAIASVIAGGDPGRLSKVRAARRDLRRRRGNPWAEAFAALLEAGTLGDPEAFSRAAGRCEQAGMKVFAAAARRQAARLAGREGDIAAAEAAIAAAGARAPDRFAELLVPALSSAVA